MSYNNPFENYTKEDFGDILRQICGVSFSNEYQACSNNPLGIDGWQGKKFSIRNENTPSCVVNDGWWRDMGSGITGNIISLLAEHQHVNPSEKEVYSRLAKEAEQLLGINGNNYQNNDAVVKKEEREYEKPYSPEILLEWETNKQKERGLFDAINSAFLRHLTPEQKEYVEKELKMGLLIEKFTPQQKDPNVQPKEMTFKRVVIPEIDQDGFIINSYGYNRKLASKGRKRTKGAPSLCGANRIKNYQKDVPILYNEGHTDYAHAIGFMLNALTLGSASMPFKQFLFLLKGREIHIFCDNDKPGVSGATRWAMEIFEYNKNLPEEQKIKVVFFLWSKPMEQIAYSAQYNVLHSYLKRLYTGLKYEDAVKHFDEIIDPKHLVYNWSPVYKEKLEVGFDFTDFIGKSKNTEDFEKFISKYRNK